MAVSIGQPAEAEEVTHTAGPALQCSWLCLHLGMRFPLHCCVAAPRGPHPAASPSSGSLLSWAGNFGRHLRAGQAAPEGRPTPLPACVCGELAGVLRGTAGRGADHAAHPPHQIHRVPAPPVTDRKNPGACLCARMRGAPCMNGRPLAWPCHCWPKTGTPLCQAAHPQHSAAHPHGLWPLLRPCSVLRRR